MGNTYAQPSTFPAKIVLTILRFDSPECQDPTVRTRWLATTHDTLQTTNFFVPQGFLFRVMDDDGILLKGTLVRVYYKAKASISMYLAGTDTCILRVEKDAVTCLSRNLTPRSLYLTCPSFCCEETKGVHKPVIANLEIYKR